MTTFAHIENSTVLDPQANASLAEYVVRFNGGPIFTWMSEGHTFKQVADADTNGDPIVHGATDNGDGTYTNPPPPSEDV